jgi:transcriptional regulator with XRE-family HTH domain
MLSSSLMTSADLLREARLRAGLTQAELARAVGRTQPAIARWESGRVEPSLETLRELIRACRLELTVGLANYDDSYDRYINDLLDMTPAERVADAIARERVAARIRGPAVA